MRESETIRATAPTPRASALARRSPAPRRHRHAGFRRSSPSRRRLVRLLLCEFHGGSRRESDLPNGRRYPGRWRRPSRHPQSYRLRSGRSHARMDGAAQVGPTTTFSRPAYQCPGASPDSCFRWEEAAVLVTHGRSPIRSLHASQVVFSQLAAAVDSLCDVPGFGQLGGAVMSRIGIVMIDFGSQTGNSYLGSFLVMPMIVSL